MGSRGVRWGLIVASIMVSLLAVARGADEVTPPTRDTWIVDGVTREALIHWPARPDKPPTSEAPTLGDVPGPMPTTPRGAPVIFAFHGHGGTARSAAEKFGFQRHWPEAIVVYMQGLPTVTPRDPQGRRAGWQNRAGLDGDRDLKFFDAVYEWLQTKHSIDFDRIYATGHSNGGGFTYLLWSARGDRFAAFAPSAALGGRRLQGATPKPVLHVMGEQDQTVPIADQRAALEHVRRINGCTEPGEPWGAQGTRYPSQQGAEVIAYVHAGTHQYPEAASIEIVRFFRDHTRAAQPVATKVEQPE